MRELQALFETPPKVRLASRVNLAPSSSGGNCHSLTFTFSLPLRRPALLHRLVLFHIVFELIELTVTQYEKNFDLERKSTLRTTLRASSVATSMMPEPVIPYNLYFKVRFFVSVLFFFREDGSFYRCDSVSIVVVNSSAKLYVRCVIFRLLVRERADSYILGFLVWRLVTNDVRTYNTDSSTTRQQDNRLTRQYGRTISLYGIYLGRIGICCSTYSTSSASSRARATKT